MDHFFAPKFCIYFSGNPPNVGLWSIFAGSKTLEKVIKITHFDVLRGPFVDLEQASRRVPKIMQNYTKIHIKSPQNDHKIIWHPVLQWSRRTPSLHLRKCIKMRSFLSFPVLLCSRHGCKNRSKSSKINH